MNLERLGWSEALASHFQSLQAASSSPLLPGRVVRQESHWLRVATEGAQWLAHPSGRFSGGASDPLAGPVVGDWVGLRITAVPGERALIDAVLPRTSLIARRARDDGREAQALAANVQRVLIVVGLDRPPNLRWLERATTLVWDSGAQPLVVLNKADLVDASGVVEQLEQALPGTELIASSTERAGGLEVLRARLPAGETAALLGVSGVGKSSIMNGLMGGDSPLLTGEVRASDGKGRHTTTHRELLLLPHGAMLIDGPGMRELGLWMGAEGLESAFPDIEQWSSGCHFGDCQHAGEPGCAVERAVQEGELDAARLESYAKLRLEQAWLESRATAEGRTARKRAERSLTRAAWSASRAKRRS